MAAGHYVDGICVDAATSTHIYYSQIGPDFFTSGGGTEVYKVFAATNNVWYLDEYTISSNGAITLNFRSQLPIPSLATCTYEPELSATDKFVDGNVLGWGVALAMVGAWAIHAMRRGL